MTSLLMLKLKQHSRDDREKHDNIGEDVHFIIEELRWLKKEGPLWPPDTQPSSEYDADSDDSTVASSISM